MRRTGFLAAALAAGLAAGCLLTGCTGGGAHQHPHALTPAQRIARLRSRFGIHPIVIGNAIGGGGPVAFIGGGGGAGSRPKITLPPIPPANSSLTIQMPLEAYQAVSTQQQETLAQASNLLTQRCMAARGFDDTSPSSEPFSNVASLEAIEAGGAGLTSVSQAKTFGFARPKGAGFGVSGGPAIIGFVGTTFFGSSLKIGRAYTEALLGFGPGFGPSSGHQSCLQQASHDVYGQANGEPVPDPVPQIAQQSVGFTESDPHVKVVQRAWSACMARYYYHYSSPNQVEAGRWPKSPSKAEIRTAVADVKCKARVNYLNTWLAVEAGYQRALIGRNLAALSQLQVNFAPLLNRAETALAEASGLSTAG